MQWNDFQKIAHRGFSKQGPGNTIDAFEQAILAGATMIETDIQWVDGSLIIAHDPVHTRSPTDLLLSSVFEQLHKRTLYYLEFKTAALNPQYFPQVLVQLKKLIAQFDLIEYCILVSFDVDFLQEARRSHWPRLGVNHEGKEKPFDAFNCIDHQVLDGPVCEPTYTWTVNDTTRMKQLIDWGVNGIVTDSIDQLVEVTAQSNSLNKK